MRYCFDLFRSPTTVSDVLHNHRLKPAIHEPEKLLDHYLNSAVNNGQGAWTTRTSLQDVSFNYNPCDVYMQYRQQQSVTDLPYQDAHSWCFVPASFELLMFDLKWMSLTSLVIQDLKTVDHGVLGSEFLVKLQKKGRSPELDNPEYIRAKRIGYQFQIIKQLSDRLKIPFEHYS